MTGDVDRVIELPPRSAFYVDGMPAQEVYAQAYFAAGVSTYSSAIFNSSEYRRYQGVKSP